MVNTLLAPYERYAPGLGTAVLDRAVLPPADLQHQTRRIVRGEGTHPDPLAQSVGATATSAAIGEGVVVVGKFGVGASPRMATDA